jgi:hypothetical protein
VRDHPRVNPLVRAELEAVDWAGLRLAKPGDVPETVERLLSAATQDVAERAYGQLASRVVPEGNLHEGAAHLVPVLLAALAGPLPPNARVAAVDLLAEICDGEGDDDLGRACRRAAAEGTWLLYGLLLDGDARLREWALHVLDRVDRNRARVEAAARRLAAHDPHPRVREAAAAVLDG